MKTDTPNRLNRRKYQQLGTDTRKFAEEFNLVYIDDRAEGIVRLKHRSTFIYKFQEQKITDPSELERIKKLVIPPAWTEVWICRFPDGHIQATGRDALGRKQY